MKLYPTPVALAVWSAYGRSLPRPQSSLRVLPCNACNGGALRKMTACPRCGGSGRLLAC